MIHWLTSPSNAGGVGLIPGVGAKIPKQKEYFNKFNKDFKNAQHLYLYIYIANHSTIDESYQLGNVNMPEAAYSK